ncbi:MAG TPA: helix-turn-helix domain-containing protein [Candidatus Dormibacteraeota bacterium]
MTDRRAERGEATRRHLVATATRLFAERGYEATPIELVLAEARVSRGALYHHFASKEALFEAALDATQAGVAAAVRDAARRAADPLGALRAGCATWLALARDPAVRRIVLLDAPGVVGWERWREIDQRHSLGAVMASLRALANEGRLPRALVDVHAHVLLAGLTEVALLIARAEDPEVATERGEAVVARLLSGLVGDGG